MGFSFDEAQELAREIMASVPGWRVTILSDYHSNFDRCYLRVWYEHPEYPKYPNARVWECSIDRRAQWEPLQQEVLLAIAEKQ